MSDEDYYSNRNGAARFTLASLEDKDEAQYAKIDGLPGETFEKVIRIQPHGFTSHPPPGSHMLGIGLGNRRNALALLGGESSEKRHRNIGEGNTAIYNADGTIMKMVGKNVSQEAGETHTIKAKKIVLECGSSSITIEDGKVVIKATNIFTIGKTAVGVDSESFPVKIQTESGPADKAYSKV